MNDPSSFKSIRFQLNRESRVANVAPHLLLSDFLRDHLGLKGTRKSCEVEICGACTVLVNGRPVSSCATPAFEIDGKTVTTIEGLAEGDKLHPIQRAFWEEGGFECGYCTPGMILLAYALFTENPQPSEEEIKHWLSSNLCRCTGYVSIIAAIKRAGQLMGGNNAGATPIEKSGHRSEEESTHGLSSTLCRCTGYVSIIAAIKRAGQLMDGNNADATPIETSGHRRLDGLPKINGEAIYPADLSRPGMLYAKILRSPLPYAVIKKIDTDAAEKLPGVVAVLTRDDLKNL